MYDPYEVLGLQDGSARVEAKQAYLRLMELYSHDSLATYTLLTDSERTDRLERIETAYQSILELFHQQAGDKPAKSPELSQSNFVPDPELSTGAYLRWTREQAGLSIRQLADRTKISSVKLEDIESERYDRLPPIVYLRGFVREFARSLGLADACQLSEFYLKRISPEPD